MGFTDEPSWIINCQFLRNLAGEPQSDNTILAAQGGGALFLGSRADERAVLQNTTLAIANSRFADNAVRGRGAAIRMESAQASSSVGRIFIKNTTVAFNSILQTDTGTTDGGGQIWVEGPEPQSDSRPVIVSSIVYFTVGAGSSITGPGSVGTSAQGSSPLSLVATYSNIQLTGPTGVYGAASTNLDENPDFVNNAFRNFRLRVNSPCRNTGFVPAATSSTLVTVFPDYPDMDDLASANPANDPLPLDLFLGEARVQGGQIDMGCHEFRE